MQLAIYAISIFFLIARFKSVVRPAMRDPFLWALMAIVVTSFSWSDFPYDSRKYGLTALLTTLFGVYLASRYSLKEQLRIVAWAVGIAAVFSLFYSLALRGAGVEQGLHPGAWRGPLMHKNMFARLMVVSALPPLLVAMNARRYRYVWWAVFGLTVVLILLSTSKTALVILITLMILVPLYKALRWSDNLAIPFFITIILVGGSIATWTVGNWENFLFSLGRDPTLSGRTYIWDAVMEKIWERPWLGYGFEAFWIEGGESSYVWRAVRYKVYQAHNGFLNLGVEIGLLGLLFFGLSILFAYIRAINWARFGKTSESLWPLIYVTFLPMYNYTESTIVEQNSIYWVLFVAITLSLKRVPMANTRSESESLRKEMAGRTSIESLP
ncbi:O-antigen ligase family protein [Argonema galeatum]|uniref:O-antigen ligase family protein n=1 Tax=Argonema galeatum TaxID=2942762 RepID=UPI00201279EE|nr:O-antigen ligase [Argonema galeatum]